MSFLENLKLDSWWKAVLYLGVAGVASSFIFQIQFIQPKHLFGMSVGLILIGIAKWIAQKDISIFKPANAWTGGAGFVSWKETHHNLVTVLLFLAGLVFIGYFGYLIFENLI